MKNRYNLSVSENIFVAKRNIVDYIYKSAKLEGLNITFPETYAIYEKARVKDVDMDTILVVNNLKHGWKVILDAVNAPIITDLNLICSIHKEVARDEALEWGKLRTGRVGISGTNYLPPIPESENVEEQLKSLLEISNPTDRAITIMFWGMKSQLFWDGNKRTSMLLANKIMIENGCGIISVPSELIQDFSTVLSAYYDDDENLKNAKSFVYDKCIDGIHLDVR